jgi:hypothetical protein
MSSEYSAETRRHRDSCRSVIAEFVFALFTNPFRRLDCKLNKTHRLPKLQGLWGAWLPGARRGIFAAKP